ncbi:MAG: MjaI family restriction endonuclease [Nanoarchaeota archaeon]
MKKRIPSEKEKLLNPIVGRFNFTSQYKVGTVTNIILLEKFNNIDEWEKYYYNSGRNRQRLEKNAKTKKELSILKKGFGRTEEELEEIGKELYKKVEEFKKITLEDCKNCIKQYVIDNTWEGIIEREQNTIKKLEESIKEVEIKKTPGEIDASFSVDYEIEIKGSKIGIQIKPPSYLGHDKANIREQNKQKQEKYSGKVFTVVSEKNGEIQNKEIIDEIKKEIERLS